ncbi:hypothetical protein [Pseudomonas glycinae]|uniref:hypothetical protein n=1 Tax=Pseudomonas glycinae TaxID=1785145 RepID=UPI0021AA49F2|nr:hypothetical protein [Pseudomonas glycinae]
MLSPQDIKDLISSIKSDCKDTLLPPENGLEAIGQPVIPFALVRSTRGYLEKITHQINGAYTNGWYDASAVMIRRLIETLIIETFESHNIASKIKNTSGDFFYLSDLISITLTETSWNLSRNSKQSLPKLKDIGDKSAHSRRYNAVRHDIDKIISDLRVAVQELIYLSGLK